MKVHEIVDNSTLEVVPDTADDDLLADVHDLEVGQVGLLAVGVNGAVNLFVVADAVAEVEGSSLGILAAIIGATSLDVADVGHDELLIVTLALDKEDLDAVSIADL